MKTREGNRKPQSGKRQNRRSNRARPQLAWLVGVAILSIAVVPGYLVTQMQKRVERMQGELDSATVRVAHLERTAATLKQGLQETDLKRNVLQRHLDNWQTRFESMRGGASKAPRSWQSRLKKGLRSQRSTRPACRRSSTRPMLVAMHSRARPPERLLLGCGNRNQTCPCLTMTFGSSSRRRNRLHIQRLRGARQLGSPARAQRRGRLIAPKVIGLRVISIPSDVLLDRL